MTIAARWRDLKQFIADTWRRTASLWWSQGINVFTGIAYGKLVTLFVAPAVLGLYNLQLATAMLVHGIVVSPMIQSYMSALQQYPPTVTRRFYSRMLVAIYGMALVGILVYIGLAGASLVGWLMWVATCLQGAYLLNNGYFTAFGHVNKLALVQLLNPLGNLIFLLALVATQQPVTTTWLWICTIGLNTILWGISFYYVRRQGQSPPIAGPRPTQTLSQHARAYGTPLLLQAVFSWANNYIDKYIIGLLMTESAVGYYSAGYSMGSRIAFLGAPLVTRLTMSVYALRRTGKSLRESRPILKRSLLLLWLMGSGSLLVLYVFADQIGLLFLSEQYRPSFHIIPLIGLAYLFLVSTQLVDSAFFAYEKTIYILFYSVGSAIINISLNFLLIPTFGIYGAAYAMVISMLAQLIIALCLYRNLLTRKSSFL